MKTYIIALVLLVSMVFSHHARAEAQIGADAPAFELPAADGKTYKLEDFKGKVVVLEWFNHQCPFIRKYYDEGNMQALQEKYTAEDIVWLSVISSAAGRQGNVTAEEAMKIQQEEGAHQTAILLDPSGDVGRLYGAKTTPHMFVVDKEGKLAYMGAIDSVPSARASDIEKATNYVTQAISELQQGKPVSKAVTVPYGCSVKYDRG